MATTRSPQITQLLIAWTQGEQKALEDLVPIVHRELKRQARRYMQRERDGHTLEASALVNEAYLRLGDADGVQWEYRAHFFAVSARLMRQVLVDHARRRAGQRRAGFANAVSLNEAI